MDQNIFCLDIPNQLSNDSLYSSSDMFTGNNVEIISNIKNQNCKNQILICDTINNVLNESKTLSALEKLQNQEKEKNMTIVINDNTINHLNINNNSYYNINNTEYNFKIKNNYNWKYSCNCSSCNEFEINNCFELENYFPFNENINNKTFEDNFNDDSNLNESNTYSNHMNNVSSILNTNNKLGIDEDLFFIQEINSVNDKINKGNEDKKIENNFAEKKTNINLNIKRRKRKKKEKNKIKLPILYGHPKKNTYKTNKQRLNIHKKLDLECRNDTILLIYGISKLKKVMNKLKNENNNSKDKIYFQRIQTLYKDSILSLPHKEYAQDIIGYTLV